MHRLRDLENLEHPKLTLKFLKHRAHCELVLQLHVNRFLLERRDQSQLDTDHYFHNLLTDFVVVRN